MVSEGRLWNSAWAPLENTVLKIKEIREIVRENGKINLFPKGFDCRFHVCKHNVKR